MTAFVIEERAIGAPARCFVIAEAGVNHNGELGLAHQLVDAAADAGADAVKFQTFDPDALVAAGAPLAAYQQARTSHGADEDQRAMLRKLVLSHEAHVELQRHARDRGILFLSTPFEEASADFLEALGLPAFKVPSGEITNLPFLAHLARKRRPLLVSTGMSDLAEVDAALAAIRGECAVPVALFHCTSSYPAPPERSNLRAMATLRERFAVPTGYSDHTLGQTVPLAAIALGAELLEKHLTLDVNLPGPDHAASMEPGDFRAMVTALRAVESALGDGDKRVQACEIETRRVARKSLFAARDLAAGHALGFGDVVARRPGTGLSPARLPSLLGRLLRRSMAAGTQLSDEDLD